MFIDALLIHDGKNDTKIGIFRKPYKSGLLSKIDLLQRGKESLEKIILGIDYITYNKTDFGFTISSETKNYIYGLVEAINNNLLSNLNNIVKKIQEYYDNLIVPIHHKIK